MAVERTLAICKPDSVRKNQVGEILRRIQEAGFVLRAIKMVRLTQAEAEGFYEVHAGRPFFGELTEFMSSGPCVPMVLEKDSAIADYRALIGATDPAEAAPGTIRADLAESKGKNAVHGSDSVENGRLEANFFFPEHVIVANS